MHRESLGAESRLSRSARRAERAVTGRPVYHTRIRWCAFELSIHRKYTLHVVVREQLELHYGVDGLWTNWW